MLGPSPGALRLTAAAIAAPVLLAYGGCSGEDPAPAPSTTSMLAGAVGYGESRDTAYGSHKVNEVVDPVSAADARAAGVRTKGAEKVVAAVVSECAQEAMVLSRDGWSALLTGESPVAAAAEPAPATEGAPSIDRTRRVPAGACVYARVLFVVPSAAEVAGIHYAATGARTATWRASVGTSGRPESIPQLTSYKKRPIGLAFDDATVEVGTAARGPHAEPPTTRLLPDDSWEESCHSWS